MRNQSFCDLRTSYILHLLTNIAYNVLIKFVHNKKSSEKTTFRTVLKQGCAVFCKKFADLRFADSSPPLLRHFLGWNTFMTMDSSSPLFLNLIKIGNTKMSNFLYFTYRGSQIQWRIVWQMSPLNKNISWLLKNTPPHFQYSARNYRPCFRENQPKRSFSIKWKRAFWACFRENWVYKFGHCAADTVAKPNLCRRAHINIRSLYHTYGKIVWRINKIFYSILF